MRLIAALLGLLAVAVPAAAQPPPEIAAELRRIGRVIAPPPTAVLYAPLHPQEVPAGFRVERDASYGPDPRNRLDVIAPEGAGSGRRVLLFIHGGGFVAGDKRMAGQPAFYDNIALWAARQGMVGVNMTYRLAPAHPWPAVQEDIAGALLWIGANISRYGGDPAQVFVMGHSAGAIHAALFAAEPRFLPAGGAPVRGWILVSGLFTFGDAGAPPNERGYLGEDPSARVARSPAAGLLRVQAPVFLAFSELNPPRFNEQNEALARALAEAGRAPVVVRPAGHSHISEILAIGTADTSISGPLAEFLKR
jgi:triacylglycerol lipase